MASLYADQWRIETRMKWGLDIHPFMRSGSIAIVTVSGMHAMQAALLLYSPLAGDAIGIKSLLIVSQDLSIPGGGQTVAYSMIVTAILGLVGTLFRMGWIRLLIFTPQHIFLGIMAIGGLWASAYGAYLDDPINPWVHIFADRFGITALFVVHTSAMIRRARDLYG